MCAAIVEPHDKMRARDVNKVARGEQAPRPPQQSPQVSRAPPPSTTTAKVGTDNRKESSSNQMRRCYDIYFEYHRCIEENGKEAEVCKKVAEYYKIMCPDWIGKWSIEWRNSS